MNYIAHIHLGHHTQTSLLGNFLGDFVKGSDLRHLPVAIEQGIRLHRSADTFTDSHPLIVQLKQGFPKNIRRVAGVVIDIYFDHLLLTHWQRFTALPYNLLFEDFYTELEGFCLPGNPKYKRHAQRLIKNRWLKKYIHIETCKHAFISIEKRLNGRVEFAVAAYDLLQQEHQSFDATFLQFYPALLEHGLHLTQSNQKT